MADELEERLLAQYGSNAVRGSDDRRYEVEPYRDPLASSNFKQFEWAKNNPQIASSLAQLLQYLSWPVMKSPQGASVAHRAGLAANAGPSITGGKPGYSVHDQWSPYGVPAHKDSSTGLSYYNWYGMRDANTGRPLPKPWPNYRGNVDPADAMMSDMANRLARGDLDHHSPTTAYDQAVANQLAAKQRFKSLEGGRQDVMRSPPANMNDAPQPPPENTPYNRSLFLQLFNELERKPPSPPGGGKKD